MQSLQRLRGRFFSQLGCCGGFSLISQLSAHERWDDDPINGGTSIARWFMSWKIPSRKGMMTAGTPMTLETPKLYQHQRLVLALGLAGVVLLTTASGTTSVLGPGVTGSDGHGCGIRQWFYHYWLVKIIIPKLPGKLLEPALRFFGHKKTWSSHGCRPRNLEHHGISILHGAGSICEENQLRGCVEM